MVTIQQIPDKEGLRIVIDGIKRNYKGYSMQEFIVAFELFIDDRLQLKDHKHFNTFDFIYLRKIMNAYKNLYRGKAIIENNRTNQLNIEGPKKKPIQEQEKEEFDLITEHYKQFKTSPTGSKHPYAFEYAERNGIISLTIEEKKQIKANTIKKLEREIRGFKLDGNSIGLGLKTVILNNKFAIKTQCKIDYFKEYLKDNFK